MKILLIEDNQEYLESALEYMKSPEVTFEKVKDLSETLEVLDKIEVDGVITDLFFPLKTGSGDKSEGKKILAEVCAYYNLQKERIFSSVAKLETAGKKFRECVSEMSKILGIPLDPARVYDQLRENPGLGLSKSLPEPEKKLFLEQYKLSRELQNKLNYNPSELSDIPVPIIKRGMAELIEVIADEDEALQPLGVRVVEKAKELCLPVVVVTSHHAKGQFFAPVVAEYLFGSSEVYHDIVNTSAKNPDVFVMFKSITDDFRTIEVPERYVRVLRRLVSKIQMTN